MAQHFNQKPEYIRHGYLPTTQQPGYSPVIQPVYPSIQPGLHPGQAIYVGDTQPITQIPGYRRPVVPGGNQWMNRPMGASNCSPGLEYLTKIDQLIVDQQVDFYEAFCATYQANNKYMVKNSMGQNVYYAVEETDMCSRDCCGPARPFDIRILNNDQKEVMHISRPFRCTSCCFPCCLQELTVTTPSGNVMGYITQKWSFLTPKFELTDGDRNPILLIEGPMSTFNIGGNVEFKVLSLDGNSQVGRITKQWGGYLKETYTDADTFSITFPMNLDVEAKATMLGACFLIDFMYFERPKRREDNATESGGRVGRYHQMRT